MAIGLVTTARSNTADHVFDSAINRGDCGARTVGIGSAGLGTGRPLEVDDRQRLREGRGRVLRLDHRDRHRETKPLGAALQAFRIGDDVERRKL